MAYAVPPPTWGAPAPQYGASHQAMYGAQASQQVWSAVSPQHYSYQSSYATGSWPGVATPCYGSATYPQVNASLAQQAYLGYPQTAPTFEEIWHANAAKAASGPFKFYAEPPLPMQSAAVPPLSHPYPSPTMAVEQHAAETPAAFAGSKLPVLEERGLQAPETKVEQAPPLWAPAAGAQVYSEGHFTEEKLRDVNTDLTQRSWQPEDDSLLTQPLTEKKDLAAEDAVTAVLRAALTADKFADMHPTSPTLKGFRTPVVEVRDVDAESKEPCAIAPTVVVQPGSAMMERNALTLPVPTARRRPCHLQILTGADDMLLTPSPSTRPASATSVTSLDGVFERLQSDSLVASSPSRLSETGLMEGVVAIVPPTQPLDVVNRELPVPKENALREAAITNPAPIMGRGIVKALPFDADGREHENIFDAFNAQASVEAAVAAVVPLLNITEGASPSGASLPPKRASDLWSHGTPVYRSPQAASPVSVASSSSLDSAGRSLPGVPPRQASHVVENTAELLRDFDDAASVETVVAPVDPDRLPPGGEELLGEPGQGSAQYFDLSPAAAAGRMPAAAAQADDCPTDNAVPAERLEVLGSPRPGSAASLSQSGALRAGAAPFPLFGEDSPNDALGGLPSIPSSPTGHSAAPVGDSNSPIMYPPVPPPPEPLPEPKTVWARKDVPPQASTPPRKAPMPWPFDGTTGFSMQSASYDAGTPSDAGEPAAVEVSVPTPPEAKPAEEGQKPSLQEGASERPTAPTVSREKGLAASVPARRLRQDDADAAKPSGCMPRSASAGAVSRHGATQRSNSAVSTREKKAGRLSKAKDSLRKTFHLRR